MLKSYKRVGYYWKMIWSMMPTNVEDFAQDGEKDTYSMTVVHPAELDIVNAAGASFTQDLGWEIFNEYFI